MMERMDGRPATFVMTMPAHLAHVLRVLDLGRGLVERGHRVVVHARASEAERVRAAGATHVPYAGLRDYHARMQAAYAEAPAAMIARRPYLMWRVRRAVLEAARETAEELEPILRR